MSPCDSLGSPEVEYIDNNETAGVHSIEKKASSALYISEQEATGVVPLNFLSMLSLYSISITFSGACEIWIS